MIIIEPISETNKPNQNCNACIDNDADYLVKISRLPNSKHVTNLALCMGCLAQLEYEITLTLPKE